MGTGYADGALAAQSAQATAKDTNRLKFGDRGGGIGGGDGGLGRFPPLDLDLGWGLGIVDRVWTRLFAIVGFQLVLSVPCP